MEDTLKRLLDTEQEAEKIVQAANDERERIVHQAVKDARLAEERFESRIPEIRSSFLEKAEERAAQTIAVLERRYQERHKLLGEHAQQHEAEAIEAAVELIVRRSKD